MLLGIILCTQQTYRGSYATLTRVIRREDWGRGVYLWHSMRERASVDLNTNAHLLYVTSPASLPNGIWVNPWDLVDIPDS